MFILDCIEIERILSYITSHNVADECIVGVVMTNGVNEGDTEIKCYEILD